jgi:hypothetical protein
VAAAGDQARRNPEQSYRIASSPETAGRCRRSHHSLFIRDAINGGGSSATVGTLAASQLRVSRRTANTLQQTLYSRGTYRPGTLLTPNCCCLSCNVFSMKKDRKLHRDRSVVPIILFAPQLHKQFCADARIHLLSSGTPLSCRLPSHVQITGCQTKTHFALPKTNHGNLGP